MVTQERLKELFDYSPDGNLVRKVAVATTKAGEVAGSRQKSGYHGICVDNKLYYTHRLVWLYHKGYFPENAIDHKNRKRRDNRIENLREVSMQCNIRNAGNFSHSTTGVKGISLNKKNSKWVAHIAVNRKFKFLGYHSDFTEAVLHRLAAEQCIGWEGCDSSSPAYRHYLKYVKGL